ncbi:MAG: hypothetical protein CEE40_00010 [Chloroflexi bacterium B3_Chlor]|nr:MAG: hypothetical protein CEE40_00010 [Chloroflexi bacterium B3_Chlor]
MAVGPGAQTTRMGFTHVLDLERAMGMAYDSQSGATVNVLAAGGIVLPLVAEAVDLLSASGGSDEMYQLTLDRGTIVLWNVVFLLAVTIFVVSLGLLCVAIAKKKSWLPSSVAGLILVSSLVAIFHTTLSPYSYYRKKIESSIAIGEEVFKRYQDYKKEHGQYPDSIGEIYFAELDYFDVIVGLRQDPTRCDGFGVGCRGLRVTLEDGEPVVHVYDELVQCDIDNLTRNWECWDHR